MPEHRKFPITLLEKEVTLSSSRSSGPGGQNVNKVNSKVTLRFDVGQSRILLPEEKEIILKKLARTLTRDGVLILSSQDMQSQLQNKEAVLLKLERHLTRALEKKKARKASKPSKGAVQNRINKKKRHAEKKKWRQKI